MRYKITLTDDSVQMIEPEKILEISQDLGVVNHLNQLCGVDPLFGPAFCPDCKAKESVSHCGKWFRVAKSVSPPGEIMVTLTDGEILSAKHVEWESNIDISP